MECYGYPAFRLIDKLTLVMEVDNCNYRVFEFHFINLLQSRRKRLRFQRSKIHEWGLVALEPIDAEDFVIEYVGEVIRGRVKFSIILVTFMNLVLYSVFVKGYNCCFAQIADIREQQYEKIGIGSSYLFRLDDDYVVSENI